MRWLSERWRLVRSVFRRGTLGRDAIAGVVLGIESVPDGLASGLLAGVNPVAGLYAYLYGMAGAAVFTSSTFMAVQGTGAMALVVAAPSSAGCPIRIGRCSLSRCSPAPS